VSNGKKYINVYIWASEASVHIIFFWWRTGPYTAIWPSVPWTICYLYNVYIIQLLLILEVKLTIFTDFICDPHPCNDGTCIPTGSSTFTCDCDVGFSGPQCDGKSNINLINTTGTSSSLLCYFPFLFSLVVFFSAAGQYNVMWTGTGLPRFRFDSGTVPALFF
jgi:hypothetical protein